MTAPMTAPMTCPDDLFAPKRPPYPSTRARRCGGSMYHGGPSGLGSGVARREVHPSLACTEGPGAMTRAGFEVRGGSTRAETGEEPPKTS